MTARVAPEDVARVAELANLDLTEEESRHMLQDLNAILDYVAELDQLNTDSVEPLAAISEFAHSHEAAALRADIVQPCLDRTEVMAQAPETDGVFFKVPKVIER